MKPSNVSHKRAATRDMPQERYHKRNSTRELYCTRTTNKMKRGKHNTKQQSGPNSRTYMLISEASRATSSCQIAILVSSYAPYSACHCQCDVSISYQLIKEMESQEREM